MNTNTAARTVVPLTDYELDRRLRAVVRPYTAGAAYGRGHVDREMLHGGTSRVLSCLGLRAKNTANADDAAIELNAAHRSATEWTLRNSSARAALADVVAAVCPETFGEAADTAAVLLLDVLGTPEDGARAFAALHYALRVDNSRGRADIGSQALAAIRSAAALHGITLSGGAR